MKPLLVGLFTIHFCVLFGQCDLTLSGKILDKATKRPLEYSVIFVENTNEATVADSLGNFSIEDLCAEDLHLSVSHLACHPIHVFVQMQSDSFITIYLEHHFELLDEVIIHGHKEESSTTTSSSVSKREIEAESYKSLADISSKIVGVSVLRNGSTSSKPIVHGLYGNRLTILNNGIVQTGQQWGNDHAPEIDASSAHHISVIKGAAALSYMGNHLGSLVLVEHDEITHDPNLRAQVNYIFGTNGRSHTFNTVFEKSSKLFNWRIGSTIKHSGDLKAPDYYLKNTGRREKNAFLILEKQSTESSFHQLMISSYNSELGILRGSHISNLTDLESAFSRDVPFFTEPNYSDSISAPRQEVNHHLIKWNSKFYINDNSVLKFSYGGQLNLRREYDVRRINRSDIPALNLKQYSHALESKLITDLPSLWTLNTGLQFQFIDNDNVFGTGILPLIPNYRLFAPSTYVILQKTIHDWDYEGGVRVDFRRFNVKNISDDVPPAIEESSHKFLNYSISSGLARSLNEFLKLKLNIGYSLRSPEINELYSRGLHQGVSGIEEGNPDLKQEKALKIIATTDWNFGNRLFVQFLAYYHNIHDYIYLDPSNEFRLTIRGAFPLFLYKQADIHMWGTDLLSTFQLNKNLKLTAKYAYIRARNRTNNNWLVNIPSDNMQVEIQYTFNDFKKISHPFIDVEGLYTLEQSRIELSQDFIEAPPAYFLLNANVGFRTKMGSGKMEFSLFGDNLLNARFRDYLNRQRYFADDLGINVGLRINYNWEF